MFYRVLSSPPIPHHHDFGYEELSDFYKAVKQLTQKYGGRVGECIATRHAFLLLRFEDAAGSQPVTAWIPGFMLEPSPPPETHSETTPPEDPLGGVFG